MFPFAIILALSFLTAERVNAHGYVHEIDVGGQAYSGWLPFDDPYADPVPSRIVRHIPDDGPVTDIHDASLGCNVGGNTPTSLVAAAPAGGQIKFEWDSWPADHLGPVSVYMASCGGNCTQSDSTQAKWFKIDAQGYDSSQKLWASATLIANNASWTTTIPSQLAPGGYLVRHEIVALHDAGAPQFYPSCAQLEVTGDGNQTPSDADLVSIPGIYDNTQWPDIWSDSFQSFDIPGPPVAFGDASADQPQPSSAIQSSATSVSQATYSDTLSSTQPPLASETASSTIALPSASSSGTCRIRRRVFKRHASIAKRYH